MLVKKCGSKKIESKKFWVPKNFWTQKKFWSKKLFRPQKSFWPHKNFWTQKNVGPKKISAPQKNFDPRKIFGPKKFWAKKNFGPKKIFGPKKFRSPPHPLREKICKNYQFFFLPLPLVCVPNFRLLVPSRPWKFRWGLLLFLLSLFLSLFSLFFLLFAKVKSNSRPWPKSGVWQHFHNQNFFEPNIFLSNKSFRSKKNLDLI